MGRIDRIFADLRSSNRKALMPFVVAGDPSLETLVPTLKSLQSAGASVVEIGIPFSDPIADGPVISQAMHRALVRGVTPKTILQAIKSARSELTIGLVAMVSESLVHRGGGPAFIEQLSDAGFDGIIIPDVDLEVVSPLAEAASKRAMSFTMLVAPTSSSERIARLVRFSTGFVYLLAREGLTGERHDAPDVKALVARVRAHTQLPLAVGFGISTAAQVKAVLQYADAAIVGSSLVRRLAEGDATLAAVRAGEFATSLLTAK